MLPILSQGMQGPSEGGSALGGTVVQGAVQEVQPSEYWLPGKGGTLQPVINIPFEVFERIYSQIQSGNQPPAYTLTRLKLAGEVAGSRADIRVDVEAFVQAGGWVAVPLGMDTGAVLADSQQYEGPGRYFLAFDPKQGYVWWVRSEQEAVHRLAFRLLAPVIRRDQAGELRLWTPQAASAEATFQIGEGAVVFEVGEGIQVRSLEPGGESSRIELVAVGGQLGRGGQLVLGWHPAAAETSTVPLSLLEASARHVVRVYSQHLMTSCDLTLRPIGGAVREVEVVLPAGSVWVPPENAGSYRLERVEEAVSRDRGETSASEMGPTVRIRFVEAQTETTTVSLSWRQDVKADEEIPVGLGTVRQAVRQYGALVLVSTGPRSCDWSISGDVRRVEPSSFTDLIRRPEEILAAFEYYSDRYSVRLRCLPQRTHITLTPHYELVLNPDYARLVGDFRFFVRGAGATTLELLTNGWQIEQIDPESLLAPDVGLPASAEKTTFRLSQPLLGAAEIKVTARRKLAGGGGRVSLPLLIPRADVVTPGSLLLRSEPNVELLFDPQASQGLRRRVGPDSGPALTGPPIRGFFWVEPAAEVPPLLTADLVVHRQEILLAAETTVRLRGSQGSLEQRIFFDIAYQPLESIILALPDSLARNNNLEFLIDGQRVQPIRWASGSTAPAEGGLVLRRILLPEPKVGRLEVTVRAPLPVPYLPPRASLSVSIPLVMPREGQWKQNRVKLLVEEGIRVQPRTERWQGAVDSFGWIEGPEILLFTEGEAHELLLALHRPGGQRIVVERAWIQTILGARWRQDQVVFRLNTAEPDVEIRLPEGTDPEEVWAAVAVGSPGNVQKFRREVTPRGALQLFLPEHLPSEPVFVELIYRLPRGLMAFQPVRVEFATIEGEVWVQRAYWQLVAPPRWHLVLGPQSWFGEYRLAFRGGLFFRQPTLEDSQLADWAGAIQPQRIPQAAEVYLFSAVDSLEPAQVVFLQRAAIVFGASALFLLVGLGLMYFPALRRPAFLWFLGLWIGAWSLVAPEYALLMGQAGLLGLALLGVAAFLRRFLGQPRKPTLPVEEESPLEPLSAVSEGSLAPSSAYALRSNRVTVAGSSIGRA
jgi:hypothetical protein